MQRTLDESKTTGVPGALPMLSTYVGLLWLVPSQRTIAAFGSVGRPATLWGLLCLVWWMWTALIRHETGKRPLQPILLGMFAFLLAILASYTLANANGLPQDEISPADSGVLRAASWAGVVLLANDGLTTTNQVRCLLRRIVIIGGLFSLLGLAQFISSDPIITRIQIPGLINDAAAGIDYRGGFTRASSTASHPLEYAVVLSATLPLALALAIVDHGRSRLRRWWPPLTVALASVVSISRSAIVGVVVSIAFLVPALPRKMRWLVGAASLGILAVAYVAVPGLIGTIRGLFLAIGGDSSTTSRTNGASAAMHLVGHYGPFGRGFGTFLPKYWILDNQILGLLIEVGAVGLATFLLLLATGVAVAIATSRRLRPANMAIVVQALAAALAAVGVLFFFFDALSFTMAGGTYFLLIGVIGATNNVHRGVPWPHSCEPRSIGTQGPHPPRSRHSYALNESSGADACASVTSHPSPFVIETQAVSGQIRSVS